MGVSAEVREPDLFEVAERFVQLVRRLEYREGWSFQAEHLLGAVEVVVRLRAEDVRGGWVMATIEDRFVIAYETRDPGFMRRLWQAVTEIEAHERLEMLRVAGAAVWAAHDGGMFFTEPQRWDVPEL